MELYHIISGWYLVLAACASSSKVIDRWSFQLHIGSTIYTKLQTLKNCKYVPMNPSKAPSSSTRKKRSKKSHRTKERLQPHSFHPPHQERSPWLLQHPTFCNLQSGPHRPSSCHHPPPVASSQELKKAGSHPKTRQNHTTLDLLGRPKFGPNWPNLNT